MSGPLGGYDAVFTADSIKIVPRGAPIKIPQFEHGMRSATEGIGSLGTAIESIENTKERGIIRCIYYFVDDKCNVKFSFVTNIEKLPSMEAGTRSARMTRENDKHS